MNEGVLIEFGLHPTLDNSEQWEVKPTIMNDFSNVVAAFMGYKKIR